MVKSLGSSPTTKNEEFEKGGGGGGRSIDLRFHLSSNALSFLIPTTTIIAANTNADAE
jgi:hypothetical protein